MLVYLSLTADLYPPVPKDWSRYSLAVEAATKRVHDRLLERMFGAPSERGRVFLPPASEDDRALQQWLCWRFTWGSVSSTHDFKGGGTYITLKYSDRRGLAFNSYRRRESRAVRVRKVAKQKLDATPSDPNSGLPDGAHSQTPAERVWEIEVLVNSGYRSEATRRIRVLTHATRDQAVNAVRDWDTMAPAEKLTLFGWRPKVKVEPDESRILRDPLWDGLLDG